LKKKENRYIIKRKGKTPDVKVQKLALLNADMKCPHPQPFSLGRREPELLSPLLFQEG